MAGPRKDLSELLIEERLLDDEGLQAARRYARREAVPLVVALIREARVTEADLVDALARRLKLERVSLATAFVELDAIREISYDVAESRCLLPIAVDRRGGQAVLRLAMANPLDADVIEEIESSTGCQVEPVLAPATEIAQAVQKHYRGLTTRLIHRTQASPGRSLTPTGEEQVTQPHHRLEDEATLEQRHKALLSALIEKGLLTDDEYIEAVKRQLRGE